MIISFTDDYQKISRPSHPVFKYVEQRLHAWLDGGPQDRRDMYESDEAIYNKRGAIEEAISNALQEAEDTGRAVDLSRYDLEAAFN